MKHSAKPWLLRCLTGAVLAWVAACREQSTESTGASWPAVPAHYALRTIDGSSLPTATGPDSARVLIDSAHFDFDLLSGVYAWTLTPFVGGNPTSFVHALTTSRVAADSFVVKGVVPGAPPPELFLAIRDSVLVLYWRPPASGESIASRIVGRRNQDWQFRAR